MALQAEDALIIGCSIGGCLLLIAIIIIITVIVQSRCCKCCHAASQGAYRQHTRDSNTSDTYAKAMAQRTAYGGLWMNNSMFPNQNQASGNVQNGGYNVDKMGGDWNQDFSEIYPTSTQTSDRDDEYMIGSRDRLVGRGGLERIDSPQFQPASAKRGSDKAPDPMEREAVGDAFQFLDDLEVARRH